MARFECTSHPSLLIVGAGQFEDGQLAAHGDDADIVRKVAASGAFEIIELDEGQEQEASQGDELFDPAEHNAESVIEYLAALDDEDPEARDAEYQRVIEAEQSGKARKSILNTVEDPSVQE